MNVNAARYFHEDVEEGPWTQLAEQSSEMVGIKPKDTSSARELRAKKKSGSSPGLRKSKKTRVAIRDDTSAYEISEFRWAHVYFTTAMCGAAIVGYGLNCCCHSLSSVAMFVCMREPLYELGLNESVFLGLEVSVSHYTHVLDGSNERRGMFVIFLDSQAKERITQHMHLQFSAEELDRVWYAKAAKAELLAGGRTFRTDEELRASNETICL